MAIKHVMTRGMVFDGPYWLVTRGLGNEQAFATTGIHFENESQAKSYLDGEAQAVSYMDGEQLVSPSISGEENVTAS